MTIRDLLRHTSGLTYGLFGDSRVDRMYGQAQLLGGNGNTLADLVTGLGELPLKHQPGARFEYSVSTDVLGRLVEVVSGMRFDEFLQQQIFEPLRMVDTGFRVPMAKRGRLALTYNRGGDGLVPQPVGNIAETPSFLSGGGGLYSTATDYLRFCQMVLNGGELDGVRVASTETVALMTSDHLGDRPGGILGLVEGFGLGFAVRRDLGAPPHGSVGELSWAGIRSTTFWIDPEKQNHRDLPDAALAVRHRAWPPVPCPRLRSTRGMRWVPANAVRTRAGISWPLLGVEAPARLQLDTTASSAPHHVIEPFKIARARPSPTRLVHAAPACALRHRHV